VFVQTQPKIFVAAVLSHLLSEMACSYVRLITDGKLHSPQKKSQLMIPKYQNRVEKAHALNTADLWTTQVVKEPKPNTMHFCA